MTSATVYSWRETQVRVPVDQARATLTRVRGLPVAEAVARLRRGPGTTCEPLARLIDKATAEADRLGCASSDHLVVVGAQIRPGEEIVLVRRKAHGKADWIASVTSDVLVQLAVGPREDLTASSDPGERLDGPPAPAAVTPIWQRALSDEAAAVLERLYEVVQNLFGGFETDRHADQAVGDARCSACFGSKPPVGGGGGVGDGAFGVAEGGGDGEEGVGRRCAHSKRA